MSSYTPRRRKWGREMTLRNVEVTTAWGRPVVFVVSSFFGGMKFYFGLIGVKGSSLGVGSICFWMIGRTHRHVYFRQLSIWAHEATGRPQGSKR